MGRDRLTGWFLGTMVSWLIIAGVILVLLWKPMVGPWVQEREGLANLRQAEQERQILVEQARAEKESASLRAEAIAIVGEAAKDFPEYRQQEYIGAFAEALRECRGIDLIYVPTEAGIPVMEAGRVIGSSQ